MDTQNRKERTLKTEHIMYLMKKRGLTPKEFAYKIRVTELALSRFLSGERIPHLPTIINMANVLECELGDIYS